MSETSTTDILLFVTSLDADYKAINRFLLDASELGAGPGAEHRWHVLMHRDAARLKEEPETTLPGSEGLDGRDFNNPWSGASIFEVQAFACQAQICVDSGLILILDDKGMKDRTAIVAERAMVSEDHEAAEEKDILLCGFNKMRVPWYDVMDVATNLWAANVGFEEFTGLDGNQQCRGGWFNYRSDNFSSEAQHEKKRQARESELMRFKADGLV